MKGFQVKETSLNRFSRRLFLIFKQNVNHIYEKLEQKAKNQANKPKPKAIRRS